MSLGFEDFTKWVRQCLSSSYGSNLNFEVICDEIFASDVGHGQVLVKINFTDKTVFLGSADHSVQALGGLIKSMGFSLTQSHNGIARPLWRN